MGYPPKEREEESHAHISSVSGISWTDNDIDAAYMMGVMNAGSFDDLKREIDRLQEMNLKPHEAVARVRGK